MTAVELRLFLREPVTVIFTFALPLMVLYILNGVFGGGAPGGDANMVVNRGFPAPDWYTPAYIGLAVAGFALIALPAHVVEYRETGVLRRFRASGVSKVAVLGSQLIVALVIASVGAVLLLVAALVFGQTNAPADPVLFVAAYAIGSLAVIAFGLMLSSLIPTTRAAQAVGLLLWFMFLFLSGSGPPPEVLPDGLRVIGQWLPLTPVIRLLQEPWLTGQWLVGISGIVAGIAVASALVAWLAYRWE